MLWPTRPDYWGSCARPGQMAFAGVANAIGKFEPVMVGVPPGHEHFAMSLLDPSTTTVVPVEQDDCWIRDTGPLFVVKEDPRGKGGRQLRGVDWSFNAWGGLLGGCYSTWEKDDMVASTVLRLTGARRYKSRMILEGGSVHVDGQGTLLATEECLLNPNRNPDLSRAEIEGFLRDYLGLELVLWLGKGIVGDTDTDGHIDNLAAFARPGEVILHWTDDVRDPQHAISLDALHRLETTVDARGRKLKVHKCLLPGPLYLSQDEVSALKTMSGSRQRKRGERLAASYVNFYLVNGAVILPGYGVPQDEAALRLFENIFPEREVVQVSTRVVALAGGNIHCITQQQPLGFSSVQSDAEPPAL